jgi:sporulation protein YlmC with PRC-barrel domain
MKSLSLLLATATLGATLGFAAPVLAQTTKKVMLTEVDPSVLTTAWRATDILGALIYDDNGVEIGKVKDMLVAANGSVPFVIVTNIPTSDQESRDVVVSASDFELVGKKLTMHGGSPAVLLGAPIY